VVEKDQLEKLEAYHEYSCPKGHKLKSVIGFTELPHVCKGKGCGKKLSDQDAIVNFRRCHECDFDLCEKCAPRYNKWPILKLRKSIMKIFCLIHMVAYSIISTKFFDNLCITVIFVNSMVMMIEDPTLKEPPQFFADVDKVFLILYTIEMVLKIFGHGFIMS
jgi:hypothetical protein